MHCICATFFDLGLSGGGGGGGEVLYVFVCLFVCFVSYSVAFDKSGYVNKVHAFFPLTVIYKSD